MKKIKTSILVVLGLFCFSTPAFSHFGMLIPSDNMVMQNEPRQIDLELSFSHPFEGIGMPFEKPNRFVVYHDGSQADLKNKLMPDRVMGHAAWKAVYKINRPGVYGFVMEPQPYWEPAEDCFIVHFTKTVIAAFGGDENWDREFGLKTEIVPLSRPFGLYAGNVFQGIVKLDGKPVPFATVEVEFFNKEQKAHAPSDYMVTQTIKADKNGVFTYAVPKPGWWGFAALNLSDEKRMHLGKKKDIELGAVIWVKFESWQEK